MRINLLSLDSAKYVHAIVSKISPQQVIKMLMEYAPIGQVGHLRNFDKNKSECLFIFNSGAKLYYRPGCKDTLFIQGYAESGTDVSSAIEELKCIYHTFHAILAWRRCQEIYGTSAQYVTQLEFRQRYSDGQLK